MDYTFELIVCLRRDNETLNVSKRLLSIYMTVYVQTGLEIVKDFIADGWQVVEMKVNNFEIITSQYDYPD